MAVGIDGELSASSLPLKQLKLVQAWVAIYVDELYAVWNNAVRGIQFGKITPETLYVEGVLAENAG